MQTQLADFIKHSPDGREADEILRSCVHCGFCLSSCPTYQVLNEELDGPRGRIYLIKLALETGHATEKTRVHLDRCLTCLSCETACPSGVRYGRLLDIGREFINRKIPRPGAAGFSRALLRNLFSKPKLFASLVWFSRRAGRLLPPSLRVPKITGNAAWPTPQHQRKMLLLDGCVQPTLAPGINAATARVLDRLGISLVRAPKAQCCGALPFHLDAQDQGVQHAKRNIDAWWPYVEQGIEAIVITASGCGVMVKQYDRLLQHYPEYAEKSKRVSSLAQDVSHIIAAEREKLTQILASSKPETENQTLAFHSPCTLQHGLKTRGVVENVLRHCGFELCQVKDEHLCCGSAGTYSILQPEMSQTLLKNKIKSLHAGSPQIIATANIGCLIQLRKGTQKPVHHWIEILDNKLQNRITEN